MHLSHKNIVLTGGTTGIGREMVARLYADNNLVIMASNEQRLAAIASEFPGVRTLCVDLSQTHEIDRAAAEVVEEFDSVDVLINNAAIQYLPTFTDVDFEVDNIEREIAINFSAVCRLTYRLLPAMQIGTEAVVLNVNSGLALAPKSTSAIYCATKAALDNFSRGLRYQLEGTGVLVLQAFLPLVDTPMTEGRGSGKMAAAQAAEEILTGIAQNKSENYIGKSKLLSLLMRLLPSVGRNIMKQN